MSDPEASQSDRSHVTAELVHALKLQKTTAQAMGLVASVEC
jgi:hypothetical protein